MSALRDEIVDFLDDYLQVAKFRDYCPNGMQVIGRPAVERVALGVSANLECFRMAAEAQADMLITHHGLFWENMPRTVGALAWISASFLFAELFALSLAFPARFDLTIICVILQDTKSFFFDLDPREAHFSAAQIEGTKSLMITLRSLQPARLSPETCLIVPKIFGGRRSSRASHEATFKV